MTTDYGQDGSSVGDGEDGGDVSEGWCDIVGRGRMGEALSAALASAGVAVRGPFGRGEQLEDSSIVLLCVPDREIASASAAVLPGPLVGHVSASAPLSLLEPHERFVMHPLLSVTGATSQFAGAMSAIDGNTPRALATARSLAERLGMRPRVIPESSRALYHAAASIASNYLVTVEGMAERLAATLGVERSDLMPLVRSALEQWGARGARGALTGPIVRGDEETVARQRDAVVAAAPDLIPLWDALVAGTRQLASSPVQAA